MNDSRPELPRPTLMLVTSHDPQLFWRVSEAVEGGVNVIQFRNTLAEFNEIKQDVKNVIAAAKAIQGRAMLLFNNWGFMLPEASDADGIHIPEAGTADGETVKSLRRRGYRIVLGASVHSIKNSVRFERDGADYLIAGTIFASPTHPDIQPQGLGFLADVCQRVRIPVVAIGGIRPENVKDCIAAGAAGVAVLSPIMWAKNPREVAAAYRAALDSAI